MFYAALSLAETFVNKSVLFYNKINVKKSNIQKLKILCCLTPISLEIDRNNGFLHIADFGSPDFANKKFILNGNFFEIFWQISIGRWIIY